MENEKDYRDYSNENILFKDVKTKYPFLELFLSDKDQNQTKYLGKGYKMKFDRYYGYRVLSCCTYKHSIITQVVLHDPSRDIVRETLSGKECKERYLSFICNYCKSKNYCSSDCDLRKKAKALSDKQWRDLALKYNDDISRITKSIKRRRAHYE